MLLPGAILQFLLRMTVFQNVVSISHLERINITMNIFGDVFTLKLKYLLFKILSYFERDFKINIASIFEGLWLLKTQRYNKDTKGYHKPEYKVI